MGDTIDDVWSMLAHYIPDPTHPGSTMYQTHHCQGFSYQTQRWQGLPWQNAIRSRLIAKRIQCFILLHYIFNLRILTSVIPENLPVFEIVGPALLDTYYFP